MQGAHRLETRKPHQGSSQRHTLIEKEPPVIVKVVSTEIVSEIESEIQKVINDIAVLYNNRFILNNIISITKNDNGPFVLTLLFVKNK